ncbi:hypothetical protein ZIOFF_070613 [Zingiber officinale]|uniref:Protein TILLER ANGLE CONTROL 1 n=1 Tax=Zingiber officinale TaxID=94328 RepID=A0A8J5EQ02_ZINOF|nr:hypothetical protein ZIOFF_070613 [Zingiber officinale]
MVQYQHGQLRLLSVLLLWLQVGRELASLMLVWCGVSDNEHKVQRLLKLIEHPHDEQQGMEKYAGLPRDLLRLDASQVAACGRQLLPIPSKKRFVSRTLMHPTYSVSRYIDRLVVDEEIEKMEGVVVEEKEALLLHDMLRGILAIGTLGQFEDPFLLEPPYDIEEPVQQQEEVAAPAVKPVQLVNNKEEDQKAATLNEVEAKLLREDWPLLREDKEGRERGRTTLANLFAADPMAKEECNNNSGIEQLHQVKKKKTRDPIKSCTNSSNKNNKLQKKLMTRLLKKKKIHPENLNMGGEAGVQRSSLVY